MAMTPEARAAQSAKMKAAWEKRKAEKEIPPDAIQEAMANTPLAEVIPNVIPIPANHVPAVSDNSYDPARIIVQVDWQHLPMLEAQKFYACLKTEFETAGRILNARSMEASAGYQCFMCKRHFSGQPKFTDHSYVDPETGLSPRVDCCGELCVINYNAMRINQRHERDVARAAEERG
jgi:hypothetical protein